MTLLSTYVPSDPIHFGFTPRNPDSQPVSARSVGLNHHFLDWTALRSDRRIRRKREALPIQITGLAQYQRPLQHWRRAAQE
jgi:hypothetical protein